MTQKSVLAIFVLSAFSVGVSAAFSSSDDFLLPAASAGAGGIGVANVHLGDAMLQNPAALAVSQRWRLAGSAGSIAKRSAAVAGMSAIFPIDPTLGLGLSWNTFTDWEFSSYTEQSLSGAMAMAFSPYFTAGAKVNYHQLNSAGIVQAIHGSSVDLGFYSNLGDLFDLSGDIVLGGALVNAIGQWPSVEVRRGVPVLSKLGLAWVQGGWEMGIERHWVSSTQLKNEGYGVWKIGGEVGLPWALSARGGFSSGQVNRFTFGAGKYFKKGDINLDYALLTDLNPVAISHRLGLSVKFGHNRRNEEEDGRPRIQPMQLIMEPGSRRVRMARLALAVNSDETVEAWSLEIRNKKGQLIRVLKGTGTPPVDLVWDGLDEQGNAVDADDVYYQLSIKTPDGTRRGQVLALAAAGTFDASKMSIPGFQVPESGPRLIPILGGIHGNSLKRLTVDFSGVDFENVEGWKVSIVDQNGKIVKIYRGKGDLPSNLVWDGRLPSGESIHEPLGLRMTFSYTDSSGQTMVISKPVFTQEAYEEALTEYRGRPSFRLMGFHADFEPGQNGSGARLRVGVPSGRILTTVNTMPADKIKRRRAIPHQFYDVDLFETEGINPVEQSNP